MYIPYLREIDAPWVVEVISERFGNATELLTPNSIVYGGAVRDALANLPLLGDLDISVPPQELRAIQAQFDDDVRWTRREGSEGPLARLRNSNPARADELPMQEIIEFVTFGDAIVQVMVSSTQGKDKFQKALGLARQVDLVCCSVILTSDGRVFETLEGGHQDCLDRVLRINMTSPTIHVATLPDRIEKLSGRGWTNTVNVAEVTQQLEIARKKEERKKMRQHRAAQRKHKKMFTSSKAVSGLPRMEIVKFPFLEKSYCIKLPKAVREHYVPGVELNKAIDKCGNKVSMHLSGDTVYLYAKGMAPLAAIRAHLEMVAKEKDGGYEFKGIPTSAFAGKKKKPQTANEKLRALRKAYGGDSRAMAVDAAKGDSAMRRMAREFHEEPMELEERESLIPPQVAEQMPELKARSNPAGSFYGEWKAAHPKKAEDTKPKRMKTVYKGSASEYAKWKKIDSLTETKKER